MQTVKTETTGPRGNAQGWTPRTLVLFAVLATIPGVAMPILFASTFLQDGKFDWFAALFVGLLAVTAIAFWRLAIRAVRTGIVAPLPLGEQITAALLSTLITAFLVAVSPLPIRIGLLALWLPLTISAWIKVVQKRQALRTNNETSHRHFPDHA
ncbi:MAG: hypothetical protein V4671_03450 [Armatimonadota bacterium]